VTILADDPLARIDIPHFAASEGHKLESLTVEEGVIRAVLQKSG
jgi:TusA-related sulfurtransferase